MTLAPIPARGQLAQLSASGASASCVSRTPAQWRDTRRAGQSRRPGRTLPVGKPADRGDPCRSGRSGGPPASVPDRNRLTGEIPAELGRLANLQHLYLDENRLTGQVPWQLGDLTNLEHLHLQGNQLSGVIPAPLGDLSNLRELLLWHNQLSGRIPVELGRLTELRRLHLDENYLTGPIPPQLGNLIDLRELYLWNNRLSGPSTEARSLGRSPTTLQAARQGRSGGDLPPVHLRMSPIEATGSSFRHGRGLKGMGPGGETSTGVCRVRPDGGPAVAIANYRSSNVVLILIGTASCALPQGPIQHSSPDPPLLGKLRIELGLTGRSD